MFSHDSMNHFENFCHVFTDNFKGKKWKCFSQVKFRNGQQDLNIYWQTRMASLKSVNERLSMTTTLKLSQEGRITL